MSLIGTFAFANPTPPPVAVIDTKISTKANVKSVNQSNVVDEKI